MASPISMSETCLAVMSALRIRFDERRAGGLRISCSIVYTGNYTGFVTFNEHTIQEQSLPSCPPSVVSSLKEETKDYVADEGFWCCEWQHGIGGDETETDDE